METIQVEILNPKAKSILKNLADLKIISIKKEKKKSSFLSILDELQAKSGSAPSLEEITKEVESVREARYAKD
ncbi:MAG: hypothetical protein Q4G48_10165 [Bacteroidia bacterium]|nr:hypothetical protein [Bacteroidia bacterium]